MKKLIITAAPNKSSFTHKIANRLSEKYSSSEIINLYDEKYSLDFLNFQNKREMPEVENIKLIQEKIRNSEELVFVFPVWWGNMPAVMKNFFDSVFISGFAFEY
jgi:putative NADPH-quinone reductase